MSQHILESKVQGQPVRLVMGWDRPLQRYFFSLHDLSNSGGGDVLASSYEMDDDDLVGINPILTRLGELGVTLPQRMVDEVQADEVKRTGNRVEHYKDDEPSYARSAQMKP